MTVDPATENRVLFVAGFIILGLLTLGQFDHPLSHYGDLLMHDHIVQMIMFDFLFFFLWVFFWMIDRGKVRNRRVFSWLLVGLVAATLMIYLFILSEREPDSGRKNG